MDSVSADADAGHDALRSAARVTGLIALGAFVSLLLAHSGVVQFRRQTGNLVITVFSSTTPVRVGPFDLSVLLQDRDSGEPILDAGVQLHLTKTGSEEVTADALPGGAANKLLYSAEVNLDSPGDWTLRCTIRGTIRSHGWPTEVEGLLHVSDQEPPIARYWPYFVAVPAAVLLFAVNRWLLFLRRRRGDPLGP